MRTTSEVMASMALTARVLFVLLAAVVGFNIWSADNGVSNALLDWVSHIRYGDKYAHFVLYGMLAFLLHVSLRGYCWRWKFLAVPVAAVLVLLFGLGEEFSQLFSPRRQFDWVDLACNLGGVTVFTALAHGLVVWVRRGGPPSLQ